jgi:sec-independent protein translocase protein TatC
MADEERDVESSTVDDETTVSADDPDTDSVPSGGEAESDNSAGGESTGIDSDGDDEPPADAVSEDTDTDDTDAAADDTDAAVGTETETDHPEPVYGRVTPRDETVTDQPVDSAQGGDDQAELSYATPDDAEDDDGFIDDDEHTSHVPEGMYDGEDGDDGAVDGDADDEPEAIGPTNAAPDPMDESSALSGGLAGSAPESDREMPLTAHIEEMIRRLAVVLGVAGLVTLVLFPGADILNATVNAGLPSATDVINFLWNTHIPSADSIADRRPRLYGPLELILTKLKVAGLAGTIIGLPVLVYETYLFMRPGLYPKERKYYLAAVPTSLILALIGVTFAHFVVLPAIFAYFTSYTEGTAVIAFGLKETFNLILILMGYMAIVFQIPLFVELAIMMKLVTREWLENRRLLFWGAFLGLAFLVSPDPTGMAPIIIAATMIVLFEGTLAVLRWTGN